MKRSLFPCLIILLGSALTASAQSSYESPGLGPDIQFTVPSKDARPWRLWMRAFIGYDDNVQDIGNASFFSGDTSSGFLGVTIEGSYQVLNTETWIAGLALRFDQLYYLDSAQDAPPAPFYATDANDFNVTIWNPAIFLGYRFQNAPFPIVAKVVYDYRNEASETEGGEFYTLAAGVGMQPMDNVTVDVTYKHGWDDHGVIYAFAPLLNDRDGERDMVDISAAYTFNQKRSRLILAYAYMRNDSDGPNFAYDGNGVTLRLESLLVGSLFGAIQGGYSHRNYGGFISGNPFIPAPGRTEMDIYTVGLQLLLKISRNVSVDAFYNIASYRSDSPVFDSDRHIVGMGIRYDF